MDEEAEIEAMRKRAEELGYVLVKPYDRVMFHGEGADEEYELVPVSRQQTYEAAIKELHRRLGTPSYGER